MSALLTARKAEVVAKVNELVAKGNALFGVILPPLPVHFDLKGRAAGMACSRGGRLHLRFNVDMMTRDAWEHVINNTVPHEVAHSFCQFNPRLGANHDRGWQRVCALLGGNSTRCHSEAVVYGKGNTYEYTTSNGNTVRMGDKYHKHVQSGRPLTYKKGKGTVTRDCAYVIVGVRGQSLATPVVPRTAPAAQVAPTPRQAIVAEARTTHFIGAPVAPAVRQENVFAGLSKAAMARAIMLSGHTAGRTYEEIITAIMHATGHDRQLARATFKANAPKVGIPVQ
jgi:predicted SprT family Zn-dependent metalloprotease